MKKLIAMIACLLIALNISGQPSMKDPQELILGTWQGAVPFTIKSDSVFLNKELHANVFVRFNLTFRENQDYEVDFIETEKVEIIKPESERKTLENTLGHKKSYLMFLDNNSIQPLQFNIIPSKAKWRLELLLEIEPDAKGRRLKYLKEDFRKIYIKSISQDKMILLVPSRSDWDANKKEYTTIKYVEVIFRKMD